MNHVYRLIWNDLTATYVVTPETASSRGKRSRAGKALAIAATLVTCVQAIAAPTGGQISAGSGSITQAATTTTINQSNQKLAINWNSFNIAANETVNFVQPNRSAIALNRVLGTDGTQILGQLNANGQVFILNPNGVLFGKGAQVNVGGLVASTLQLSDSDFLAGKYSFSGHGGKVINEGTINAADGGYVALIGNQVNNQGTIVAKLGTVALAAGQQVSLDFAGDGLLNLTVDQAAVDALVTNKGLIQADGGFALMTAHAKDALLDTVVNNEGIVRARTVENHAGVIKLLGNMDSGTVKVAGTLDASAPNGGDGGFIDTSGSHVAIDPTARITTLAANGKTGNWLIDPPDFKIAASNGDMTGAYLSGQLTQTNMTILSSSGGSGANGDILVNDAVSWSANTTLTLSAYRNIEVNSNITATGNTAGLVLTPGTGTTGDYNLNNGAKITLSGSTPSLTIAGQAYTVINDINALQAMNNNLSGRYALGSDIDASATSGWNGGAGFVPVGTNSTNFSGILSGLGHGVTALYIYRPTTNYVGLFGATGSSATIRNIHLSKVDVTGSSNVGSVVGKDFVGGLVGFNSGTVRGVHSSLTVRAMHSRSDLGAGGTYLGGVGGIVGQNDGLIENSSVVAAISSDSGVIGVNESAYTGGLVGNNRYAGVVRDSSFSGNVTGQFVVGGLVGHNQGIVSGGYAINGSVHGENTVGGLIAANNSTNSTVSNSYATVQVTASSAAFGANYVGGLIGVAAGSIRNCYSTGAVSASGSIIGGLIGGLAGGGVVTNSYSSGLVVGGTQVGGFVGNNNGSINNGVWDTQLSGQSAGLGYSLPGATATLTGVTTDESKLATSYAAWDIASSGGSSAIWRIYDGDTAPLLRNFLTHQSVTAVASDTKVYDANGYSGGNGYTSAGADTSKVLYGGSAQGARNVGSYTIRLYSHQLGYDLSGVSSNTLTISPADLTLTTSNVVKTYDGTTSAIGSATVKSGSGTQLFGSDSLSGGSYAFTDLNAGTSNKTVTVSGVTLNDGNGGNNYTVSYANNTTSTINKVPLSATANNATTTYSGSAYTGGNGVSYSGFVNNESSTVLGGTLAYGGTSQGAKNAASYTLTPSGLTSGNYTITFNNGTLTIDRAALQVIAGSTSKIYGDTLTFAGSEFNTSGLQNNEAVGSVSLASAGATATAGVAGGPYAITPSNATGGTFNPANYNISYVNGALTISPANLTVAADNKGREYGDANPALTAAATGLRNTDTSSIISGLTTAATGSSNVGSYVIDASNTSAGANYTITSATDGTLTITPAPLAITADDKTKNQTQLNPPLTASYSDFKLGQDPSVLGGSLLLTTAATTDSTTGDYPINASGQTSTNYSITYVDGTLKVLASLFPVVPGAPANAFGSAIAVAHSGANTDVSGGRNAGATLGGNSINNGGGSSGNGPGTPPPNNDGSPAALISGLPLTIVSGPSALPEAGQTSPAAPPAPPNVSPDIGRRTLTSSGSGSFAIAVLPRISGMPDTIVVNRGIADMAVPSGSRLNITIPSDAFAHTSANATVSLSATEANGRPLPGWLRFDPATGTFSGTPPPGFRGNLTIRIAARDQAGHQAVSTFRINVGSVARQ